MSADFPVIISVWPRNSRETLRIALDIYNGVPTIDARSWWTDDQGRLRPGRSGLTLSLKHLPALAEGLAEAVRQARALGLIEAPQTAGADRTAAERQRRYRERQRNAPGDGVTAKDRDGVTPLIEAAE